jgi:aryl-alcohol dehydrogenase-like predicted oxidoreductase
MYNLVKRQAEVELLPLALAEGLGVFPYSPLGGGLLSGKYGVDLRPESGRLVSNRMYQTRYADPSVYAAAEAFTALARAAGHHPAALAVAWVASHPGVTAPLIGARNLDQLEPLLNAPSIVVDDDLRARISALTPTPPPATDRNEESSAHHFGAR